MYVALDVEAIIFDDSKLSTNNDMVLNRIGMTRFQGRIGKGLKHWNLLNEVKRLEIKEITILFQLQILRTIYEFLLLMINNYDS